MIDMKSQRTYSSPLRQQQMDETRHRIVVAALEQIAQHPGEQLSQEQVAARAGIALRTVYRHFPDREDLLDAVWQESDHRLQLTHYPETEEELLHSIGPVFTRMDANATAMRALLNSTAGREMRKRDNERRRSALERALAPATAHLDESGRRTVLGIFLAIFSGRGWEVMRDRAHLRDGEPAQAAEWAVRALLAQLYREQKLSAREDNRRPKPRATARKARAASAGTLTGKGESK